MLAVLFRIVIFGCILSATLSCHFRTIERKRGVTCDSLAHETPSNCIRRSFDQCAYNFSQNRCEKAPAEIVWPEQTISAGYDFVCAVTINGSVPCWSAKRSVTKISLLGSGNEKKYTGVAVRGFDAIKQEITIQNVNSIEIKGPVIESLKDAFPAKNYGFFSVANDHICALEKSNGTMVCRAHDPQLYNFPSDLKARYISSSFVSTCVVLQNGSLRCFRLEPMKASIQDEPQGVFEKVFVSSDFEFFACATKLYNRKPLCWSRKDSVGKPVIKNVPTNLSFRHLALTEHFGIGIIEPSRMLHWWGDETNADARKIRDDILSYGQEPMLMAVAGLDFACSVKEKDHTVICFGNEALKNRTPDKPIAMPEDLLIDIPHSR